MKSKRRIFSALMVIATGLVVAHEYIHHESQPWTRDGQVRAHIITVTPRVTGPVTNIAIKDNTLVEKGQLLFEIDDSVYQAELHKAIAAQSQAQAQVKKAKNEQRRSFNLEQKTPGSVPTLQLNNLTSAVETAVASLESANASIESAKLDLEFTKVYAPTTGYVTNFNLREGSQVVANNAVVALIDKESFWIEGFFKETEIEGVQVGDTAMVTLMMRSNTALEGHVESVGYGIAKQDGSTGVNLLPNVNPNFQWIRLAQRIPVKVKLTHLPEDLELRVGTTASVQVFKK